MKKLINILILLSMMSFLMSCSKDDEDPPTAYDKASASKGGIMYDKFWATEAGDWSTSEHITKLNTYADFYRCKQCHGWDLIGAGGSYISRGPKTTRPNVSGLDLYQAAKTKTADQLFDAMKKATGRRDMSYDPSTYHPTTNSTDGDKMPNYGQLLTDAQLWDLVKFMKEGAFDVNQLYVGTYTGSYPTGTATYTDIGKDGDEAAGLVFYQANCQSCHGANGKTIALETMSAGQFTRSKPYEVQHKVQFGQLGSSMTGEFNMSTKQMKDLYKALSNTTTFPNM